VIGIVIVTALPIAISTPDTNVKLLLVALLEIVPFNGLDKPPTASRLELGSMFVTPVGN
jgi:hypothetical protein